VREDMNEERNWPPRLLTARKWPLCIDAQLIVSIGQKARLAMEGLGFHSVLSVENKNKRSHDSDSLVLLAKQCAVKGAGLQRVQLPPAVWGGGEARSTEEAG